METARHWSYDMLLNLAETESKDNCNIDELKYLFAAEIDSPRRLEGISTVAQLLDCLERRDALSEYNIEPLYEIADHCGSEELSETLLRYHPPKEVTSAQGPLNQYRELRLAEELRHQLHIADCGGPASNSNSSSFSQPPPQVRSVPHAVVDNEKKRAAIYKILAKELGNFWRRFGRELQVGEGDLDELEIQFPRDLNSRVYRLLQLFEEDPCHEPKKHIQLICYALENCQRKDLRRKIENIMNQ